VFFTQLVNGLIVGSGYGLVAVGLNYTLGLARVFNFAYGAFYAWAAYAGIAIGGALAWGGHVNYVAVCLLTLIVMAVIAALFAVGVVFPAITRSDMTVMVATLGVSIAMPNLAQMLFGSDATSLPSSLTQHNIHLDSVRINAQGLVSIVAALVFTTALVLFNNGTRIGTRLRAAAENRELAAASGVNVSLSHVVAVVVGIIVATIACVSFSPLTVVTTTMGNQVLIVAFAAIAMAGIGRLWGALIVGFGIGVFEAMFVAYVNPTYSSVAIYAALILLLLVRPKGLFGGH